MNDQTQMVHDQCHNLTRQGADRVSYLRLLELAACSEDCRAALSLELARRPALRATFLTCEREFSNPCPDGLSA